MGFGPNVGAVKEMRFENLGSCLFFVCFFNVEIKD